MILQRLLTTDCNKIRSGKLEKKHPGIPQFPGMFLPTPMVFQAGAIHQQFFTAPQGPSCSEATAGHLILSD